MNVFLTLFIFLFILILYIYIIDQYKTSDDLEIYEFDYKNNSHLQEACDVRQPMLFGQQCRKGQLAGPICHLTNITQLIAIDQTATSGYQFHRYSRIFLSSQP